MKNNKTTTYVLLLIVMGLWLVVFYRVYKSFFWEAEAEQKVLSVSKKNIKLEEVETFVLQANYDDPFMGKTLHNYSGSVENSVQRKVVVKPKAKVEEVKIDWSFINYLGLIKNKESKKMVALVNINGRQLMVSEGEAVENVNFIKNYRDSIKVTYQGKTTFIKR